MQRGDVRGGPRRSGKYGDSSLKERRRNNRTTSQYRLKLGSCLKGVRGARLKCWTTVSEGDRCEKCLAC